MLPRSLAAELHQQVLAARALWEQDRQAQRGGVDIPHALETKYPGVGGLSEFPCVRLIEPSPVS